ncbi:MAG: SMP-30/gluconolactonase/LRE family protein [Devosia sp.]|nr:SMP-30/gluconolactonase/LRE family protein [Devosia sp.]
MSAPTITTIAPDRCDIGESPVWDERTGLLWWVDITPGTIHCIDPATGARQRWEFGEPVGSLGLCRSGRLVVALRSTVILFDPRDGSRQLLASVTHRKPEMRLNDGKVGPDGAFWVGSMDASGAADPAGTLYRVAPDGGVRVITENFRISNGLAWDGAGTRMYHSDSRGIWVDIYDFDPATGAATNRRRWLELDELTGRPDGGACDIDGNYWSGGASAGRLNCFSPDGQLLRWVDLPNFRPTMPCFGGADLGTLYVPSLSAGVSEEDLAKWPLCGAMVSVPSDTRGVPVGRFAD